MHRLFLKKSSSVLLLSIMATHVFAQGINFEKGDWASIKKRAIHQHKMIYLDVFTSWCGPCKMMAKNYFPQKEAGDFYNDNFVCYQIDAEKGEGIAIAKQYDVRGYPTNLFINASDEKVIYRTMGMPQSLDGFINNGKTALLEKNDPMSVDDYKKKLESGKYDEAFLKKYLEKNNRLAIDNDKLIDIYLDKFSQNDDKDSVILLLSKYQSGVENNGYKFLSTNQFRLNQLMKNDDYFKSMSQQYYYQNLETAIKEKNENKLNMLLNRIGEFNIKDPQNVSYQYRSKFYQATKNKQKLEQLQDQYADYLVNMSAEKRAILAHEDLPDIRKQIRWQAQQMGTTDESAINGIIAKNIERPQIKYMKEILYAQELNEIAWSVYEQNKQDIVNEQRVKHAIVWVRKAMKLTEPVEETWLPIADTYAHLVAINGDIGKAAMIEEDVVNKALASKDQGLDDYQAYLKELKK